MATSSTPTPFPNQAITINSATNKWLYRRETGYDLTHPHASTSSSTRLTIQTSTQPVTLSPSQTALVIIDMQNFFLHPALGRTPSPALHNLVRNAIPTARKAGIRLIWLNWGLTEGDLEAMPAAISSGFSKDCLEEEEEEEEKRQKIYIGLGREMGRFKDPSTGGEIDAGKLLTRGQWNAALYPPLDEIFDPEKGDVWIHKNRMSGLWGASTPCEEFLKKEGIRTLLFSGVNTDQCVGGTLQDAFSKGYDCILLGDACGTTSPGFAQQGIEYNAARVWGFMATSAQLREGVDAMHVSEGSSGK